MALRPFLHLAHDVSSETIALWQRGALRIAPTWRYGARDNGQKGWSRDAATRGTTFARA